MKKGNEKSNNLTFGVRLWFDGLTTPRKIEGRLTRSPIWYLLFAILLSGCVNFQASGEVQKGRLSLSIGEPKVALAHFQRAAELDPNYLLDSSIFDEGVWTYVGRAYYTMGNLPEAQKALERARSQYEGDILAKLYLGLVLARDGDRPRGLREMEAGIRGLGGWLDNMQAYDLDGIYWDPTGNIMKEIKRSLAMIEGRDINWAELIASGEWIGDEFEEEIDLAKRDADDETRRGSDDSPSK